MNGLVVAAGSAAKS
jgi:ankyrin repeat protein